MVFIAVSVGLLGFTLPPMWSVAQEVASRGMTGLATGIINGVSYCAAAFGPALVGAIVDRSGSFDLGFLVLAGFLVVTALSLVRRTRLLERTRSPSCGRPALPSPLRPEDMFRLDGVHLAQRCRRAGPHVLVNSAGVMRRTKITALTVAELDYL